MVKLEPLNQSQEINYPTEGHFSEFEVQAHIYSVFKERGFDIRGEVKARLKGTRETCRFDLVIFTDGEPSSIIEVKRRHRKHKHGLEKTRQARRYRQFGVPCYFVYGIDDAMILLKQFQSAYARLR